MLFSCRLVLAQSFPPPLNSSNDSTTRGMYVSCGDELIFELKNNSNVFDTSSTSATPKMLELVNFCKSRYITYIAVYSLGKKFSTEDPNPIVGNFVYFDAVKRFLQVMHDSGIKVGIVITNKEFLETQATYGTFVTSPFWMDTPTLPWDSTCTSVARSNAPTIFTAGELPCCEMLNPDTTCSLEECAAQYHLSEMLKQVMRVYQYSYWVRDSTIANGCVGCSESTSTVAPAAAKYLFDYMSLEYEYWDENTFNLANASGGLTAEKAGWNAFFHISQAMLYVYGSLCNSIKMELEWRLVPPSDLFNKSNPANAGDLDSTDMVSTSIQALYIARAFNRVLMSDYRLHSDTTYPKLINKTGNIHTRLAEWPNDLNAGDRHKLMPLFSAATAGEYKHCFGTLKFNTETPPDTIEWGETFFGPGLDTAAEATMFDYEQSYMHQLKASLDAAEQFQYNWDYKNQGNSYQTIDTLRQDIAGFMWFNYSTLKNSWRTSAEYYRQAQSNNALANTHLFFNGTTSIIIVQAWNEETKPLATLQVLNMQGEEVFNATITSAYQSISLRHLAAGIYLCKLSEPKGYQSKKIAIVK